MSAKQNPIAGILTCKLKMMTRQPDNQTQQGPSGQQHTSTKLCPYSVYPKHKGFIERQVFQDKTTKLGVNLKSLLILFL